MRNNSIAFENLRVEMARKSLTVKEIAEGIGMNRDTLSRKLSRKSPIFLDEALRICNFFFPQQNIEHLFAEAMAPPAPDPAAATEPEEKE